MGASKTKNVDIVYMFFGCIIDKQQNSSCWHLTPVFLSLTDNSVCPVERITPNPLFSFSSLLFLTLFRLPFVFPNFTVFYRLSVVMEIIICIEVQLHHLITIIVAQLA